MPTFGCSLRTFTVGFAVSPVSANLSIGQTGVYKIRPYAFSHTVILAEKEFKFNIKALYKHNYKENESLNVF